MDKNARISVCCVLALFAGAFAIAALAAAGDPQTKTPHDPPLIDADGYKQLLEKYGGKALIVNFWATWCEPCRDEYPLLNSLAREYAAKGLHVVGVSLDDDGEIILVRRFLARYRPVFPNLRKRPGRNDEFLQGVNPRWNGTIPASFFYAADGRQIGNFVGAGTRDSFEAAIRTLLASGSAGGAPNQKRNR